MFFSFSRGCAFGHRRRTSGGHSARRASAPTNFQSSRVDRVRHFAHVSPLIPRRSTLDATFVSALRGPNGSPTSSPDDRSGVGLGPGPWPDHRSPPISHSSHPPLTGSRRLSRATRGSIIAAGCRPRAARIPVPVAAPAPVPPSGRFRILRSVGDLARRLPHCLLLEPSKRATSLNGRLDVNVVRAAFAIRHFDLGCEKRKSAQRDAAETRRRNESKSTNTRRTLIYELRVRLHRGVRCVACSCPALGSMPERTRPATNHDSESRRLASPPSSYRLAASRSVVAFRFADATSVCRERRRVRRPNK